MSNSARIIFLSIATLAKINFFVAAGNARDATWRPVSNEELRLNAPKVEPDAGAEALFWEISIDDSANFTTTWRHYVRIKIFDDRGREQFSKFDLVIPPGQATRKLKARVVNPNGRIFEVAEADIFKREISKFGFRSAKALSFAVPNLEVGSVFEYQYEETALSLAIGERPLFFQLEVPSHRIVYAIKTINGVEATKTYVNMTPPQVQRDNKGYFYYTVTNAPGAKTEPLMPPEIERKPWMFIQNYSKMFEMTPAKFWPDYAGQLALSHRLKEILKPNPKFRAAAAGVIGDAPDDATKLIRIFDFCTQRVTNLDLDDSKSPKEIAEIRRSLYTLRPVEVPLRTLETRQGFSREVNELFAALAIGAGFNVRYFATGDRDEIAMKPDFRHRRSVSLVGVAVKRGESWTYFNPADAFSSFGTIAPNREGQPAMLISDDVFAWGQIPMTGADRSFVKRSARLRVLPDNSVGGRIRLEYGGHADYMRKRQIDGLSQTETEKLISEEFERQFVSPQISNLTVENRAPSGTGIVITFDIRVSNYLIRTGERAVLPAVFFENGRSPVFSAENRVHPVVFDFPWTESDDVTFEIPGDFAIEPAAPEVTIRDSDGNIDAVYDFRTDGNDRVGVISSKRVFTVGRLGKIRYAAGEYKSLKNVLDEIHRADNGLAILKKK